MRIEGFGLERLDARVRAVATVIWEDTDRPEQKIFFETEEEFAPYLACNPHAFLIAGILPAMRNGERRIAINEQICPELRNGLETVMRWICTWYGPPRKLVKIEARTGASIPASKGGARAGVFLSGGLDSLAILRANRIDFPLEHPKSIQTGLLVHGFDIGAFEHGERELARFELALRVLKPVAEDAQVMLIPLYTNVRHLEDSVDFWMYEFHAAALSSVAHACAPRLSSVAISSTATIEELHAWGSHPLIDPNYSSADLQIRHEGLQLSRLDKARLVAGWDTALQNVRVCWQNPLDNINCGRCEKCVLTMTEFLIAGKLGQTRAFPLDDVSPDLIANMSSSAPHVDSQWLDLIGPLREMGRLDLVEAIEEKSARYHKQLAWEQERDWKGAVKRFDRKWLGGALFKTYSTIRNGPSSHAVSRR